MSRYPDLPYVQALNYGPARPYTQMIVIHATANTASAEAEAAYAHRRTDGVSAHFYTDNDSTVQALDTLVTAYGCYPAGNSRSVQFELCGPSGGISDATMRQAAPIVARACQEFGLPIVKVTPAQLRAGARGICGHRDVTQAWGEGDHTDPEPFPWSKFIGYIQAAAGETPQEDTMPQSYGPLPVPRLADAYESWPIPAVDQGAAGFGPAWLKVGGDFFERTAAVRLALGDGAEHGDEPNWTIIERIVLKSGITHTIQLPTGTTLVSAKRIPVDTDDPCVEPLSMVIEYGPRG